MKIILGKLDRWVYFVVEVFICLDLDLVSGIGNLFRFGKGTFWNIEWVCLLFLLIWFNILSF